MSSRAMSVKKMMTSKMMSMLVMVVSAQLVNGDSSREQCRLDGLSTVELSECELQYGRLINESMHHLTDIAKGGSYKAWSPLLSM